MLVRVSRVAFAIDTCEEPFSEAKVEVVERNMSPNWRLTPLPSY